jgi:hypothetical protein
MTTTAPPHADGHPKAARDHLWVLAVIAAFALFDVWGAWAQVGDKSGFAVGHTGTGWTLTVIVEAAAGYFLFAWFSAPGRRSRRFAMCSAFATLALSFVGQGASSIAAEAQLPAWLAVFVKDLPVVVLALIAVLIHMRRLDREDAGTAARQDVKDAEIGALRERLEALAGETAPLREALAAAQEQAAQDAQQRAQLERKLAAQTEARKRATPPRAKRADARAAQAQEDDVSARTKALAVLAAEPGISGAQLGLRVGMSKRWGQDHKPELVAMAADLEEAS